jgi:hypothetical protein
MNTSTHDLAFQTLYRAEEMAQSYVRIAFLKKKKLSYTHTTKTNESMSIFNTVINLKQRRESNIIQRIQYDTEQKMRILFDQTCPTAIIS